jgi:putative membrane protein
LELLVSALATTLVVIVAALHLWFLVLEMFLWTHPIGLRAFRNSVETARPMAVLAANQGLYNGFLAAGLLWGAFHPVPEVGRQIAVFFLVCVVAAGCFGAVTASRRILYVQAVPALVALAVVLLGH